MSARFRACVSSLRQRYELLERFIRAPRIDCVGRTLEPRLFGPLLESLFGLDSRDTSRLLLMLLLDPDG